jgi:methanogenic corrinoid protein MtbC1
VANYEQGTRFPDAKVLTAIADSFAVSLDYLLGRTDSRLAPGQAGGNADSVRRYVDLLAQGKGEQASEMVLAAARGGQDVKGLYEMLLMPAQGEVGRLWAAGRIDIGQEHYATGITRSIMERLRAYGPAAPLNGRCVVCVCAGSDPHELGLRMVGDFFLMDGWRVHILGTVIPADDVVAALGREGADLLALSLTVPWHAEAGEALVEAARTRSRAQVLVGGRAFQEDPEMLRRFAGASFARDARDAVAIGRRLVGAS